MAGLERIIVYEVFKLHQVTSESAPGNELKQTPDTG